MRLTGCMIGDLVKVDDGLPYFAEVIEAPANRRLEVRPLHGSRGRRSVSTRDVVAHWRKAGRDRGRVAIAAALERADRADR